MPLVKAHLHLQNDSDKMLIMCNLLLCLFKELLLKWCYSYS